MGAPERACESHRTVSFRVQCRGIENFFSLAVFFVVIEPTWIPVGMYVGAGLLKIYPIPTQSFHERRIPNPTAIPKVRADTNIHLFERPA